ncbi:MAG: permease-like cell division protein FtsX [Peptococcaceae bacterium]|nr:permease-like cell division protein FtsX [Peptococcaceae bacterium]
MRVSSIGYVVRDGFRNVWRNRIMSVAAISTVAISLFLLGCVWLFIANVNHMVETVESELEINAYIVKDFTRDQGAELMRQISGLPGVAIVTYVPKEEGILLLEGRFGPEAELAETVGEYNPLPDVIRVKANRPELVPELAKKLENTQGIDMVRYGQGTVERLLTTAAWVERAGLIGLVGISVAAVFLISTSIRLTVYSRREEITIMRLVGATNWYIRWPFLVEGVFIGLFGSLLACGILYFGYLKIAEYLSLNLNFIPLLRDQTVLADMGVRILIYGGGLGLVGSFLSVFRYLRV